MRQIGFTILERNMRKRWHDAAIRQSTRTKTSHHPLRTKLINTQEILAITFDYRNRKKRCISRQMVVTLEKVEFLKDGLVDEHIEYQ
jgi:hypothetical protein